jgi:hypothetical protein
MSAIALETADALKMLKSLPRKLLNHFSPKTAVSRKK